RTSADDPDITPIANYRYDTLRRIPMNRFVLLPAVVLVALPCLALGDDPKAKDDESAIDGTWLATSAELGGEKLPKKATASFKLTLKKGKYESSGPGELPPQALADPDGSLATHPALMIQSLVESRSTRGPPDSGFERRASLQASVPPLVG